mgnify:CR=1 FL=1
MSFFIQSCSCDFVHYKKERYFCPMQYVPLFLWKSVFISCLFIERKHDDILNNGTRIIFKSSELDKGKVLLTGFRKGGLYL